MTEPTDDDDGRIDVAALPDIPSRVYAFGLPADIAEDEEETAEFTDAIAGLFDKADVVIFDRAMDAETGDDAIEVHKLTETDIREIREGSE